MNTITLLGCTTRPFGGYLKALGVFRLLSEQSDEPVQAFWQDDVLQLRTTLSDSDIAQFFLDRYSPTPIIAPWNGGSGFYEKDRKYGIDAIAGTKGDRFASYREAIEFARSLREVKDGKAAANQEDERRTAILIQCRNFLPDSAVEWLDAAVGIASDGSRSFAPVLGTGGNEGRLDYTNNFMERLTNLLIAPDKKTPVEHLLRNALFADATDALSVGAATGQYDPGRAGGANQGEGIEGGVATNPWDFILALEGAVAWASGLYRRQGISYGSFLCSPFTVRASRVGYGSSSDQDDARAEIWAPIWTRPCSYRELQVLLREARASVGGRPAETGLQFAEAACSLGVDRRIDLFVRYNLLKRRGDSYVALPAGTFKSGYRSEADLVRELEPALVRIDRAGLPPGCEGLRRNVNEAIYSMLLIGGPQQVRDVVSCLGKLIRRLAITGAGIRVGGLLNAQSWIAACDSNVKEVRLAAALASVFDPEAGSIRENLASDRKTYAWMGKDLPDRLISVLERRWLTAVAEESRNNPVGGACSLTPGDTTAFIEGDVNDELIEDLLFGFTCVNWKDFRSPAGDGAEVMPIYAVLKYLFLPSEIDVGGEKKRLRSDPRVISLLRAGRTEDAAQLAVQRLRIAGLRPVMTDYYGGVDAQRLAASLLIPIRGFGKLAASVLHEEEVTKENSYGF